MMAKNSDEEIKKQRLSPETWIEIEQEYITTNQTLQQLAKKYNISDKRIAVASREGQWSFKRENFGRGVYEKVLINKQNLLVREKSQIDIRHFEIWNKLLNLCDYILDNASSHLTNNVGGYSLAKMQQLADIIQRCQGGQRLAEGMIDAAKLRDLDLAEKRLEIEIKKLPPTEDPTTKGDSNFYGALKEQAENVWGEEDGQEQ